MRQFSVGNQDDDIQSNVRKSLEISQARKIEFSTSKDTPSTSGQKRSSRDTDFLEPSSKRIRTTFPAQNRVHRRVIVRDYGKSIYKASSRAALFFDPLDAASA